jgi:carboxypeptidase D
MAQLEKVSTDCNYTGYTEKFLTYPPLAGVFPLPGNLTFADNDCDIWDLIFNAALMVNPSFNIYHIFDTFPTLWDVIGFPYVQLGKYRLTFLTISQR